MEATIEQEIPAAEEAGRARLKLTDRDRQLLGVLAEARYLSTGQLGRLFFPERHEANWKKRLLAMAGEGKHAVQPAYLRRLHYRTWEGNRLAAWTPTPLGYAIAERELSNPPSPPTNDVGVDFLEHALALNELLVRLLEAPLLRAMTTAHEAATRSRDPNGALARLKARIYARAAHPAFRWLAEDLVVLPWRERDERGNQLRERQIRPDATLELLGEIPASRQRIFIECERGTHSLRAPAATKPGATVNKLARYAEYLTAPRPGANIEKLETRYQAQYRDGFAPRVLFLAENPVRAKSIREVIAEWTKNGAGQGFEVSATTAEGAAAELLGRLGAAPSPAPPPPALKIEISRDDLVLLSKFVESAKQRFEMLGRYAKRVGEADKVHETPSTMTKVNELLSRWTS